MKTNLCPRLFEVEALRDGRLTGVERSSFERHLTTCATCSREEAELEALARSLRAHAPNELDELHLRRERTRLLAAFDRDAVNLRPTPKAGRRTFALAVSAALAATLLVFWKIRSSQPASKGADAVIRPNDGAQWSRRIEGDREQIHLRKGALWIQVRHSFRERSLIVLLPDGELEDTGTTFAVSVADGRTVRVTVEEGSVALRIRGRAPIAISAGQEWAEAPPGLGASTTAATSSAHFPAGEPNARAESADASSSSSPASRAPTSVHSLQSTTAPSGGPTSTVSAPVASAARATQREAADEFREAVLTLRRGDNADAALKFARIASRHPRDSHAEDAAYLRVIALRRAGDDNGMKDAAADYLRRYPNGFRRSEIETISR